MSITLAVFIVCLIGFCLIAIPARSTVTSPKSFFHSSSTRLNTISLVVANMTVGTGVAYLLASGHTNGILTLLISGGVFVGYRILRWFVSDVIPERIKAAPNFFSGIKSGIEEERTELSIIGWTVSAPLIFIYTLVLGFEIFASSQIFAGLMFGVSGVQTQILLSVVLFTVSLVLAWSGGVSGVFRNDRLQFVLILFFLVVLTVLTARGIFFEGKATGINPAWFKADTSTLLNLAMAILSSITTQIYSLFGWYALSNIKENSEQQKLLVTASLLIGGFIAILLAIGALSNVNWPAGIATGIAELVGTLQADGIFGDVIVAVIIVGLLSILLSTTDSLVLSLTMFIYDNVLGKDSMSENADSAAIKSIRKLMGSIFTLAFLALALMHYASPNIFYLLLAIASGAEVFAPAIILFGFLAKEQHLCVLSNKVLLVYLVLSVSTLATNLTLSAASPKLVPFVSLMHFIASCIFSLLVYRHARKKYG